jgi:hypothetical protein
MYKELQALEGVSVPTLKSFWDWVMVAFTPAYRNEIEAYLADSQDHADVERRILNLQRRGMI